MIDQLAKPLLRVGDSYGSWSPRGRLTELKGASRSVGIKDPCAKVTENASREAMTLNVFMVMESVLDLGIGKFGRVKCRYFGWRDVDCNYTQED